MKRLFLIFALALTALAATSVSGAAGASTLHFSFKGQFAEADFDSVDPSGCVETFVFVEGVNGTVKETGHPAASSTAVIVIDQFDFCTSTETLFAVGETTLAAGEFQIDKMLTTATLNATIEVFDEVSGTSFPVDISVSWAGFGASTTQKDHFQIHGPDFKVNSRFMGTFRDATASGTVSDGTTNFTPEPAVFADMGSVKQGEVDIIH
jgi:hypothetical protein